MEYMWSVESDIKGFTHIHVIYPLSNWYGEFKVAWYGEGMGWVINLWVRGGEGAGMPEACPTAT